jgi:UDP-N-acetylglucosamine 1-carboxyvinyltransferase
MAPHDLDNTRQHHTTSEKSGMDKILIQGGEPLRGRIRIGGAKNSALKLMCAGILGDGPLILENVPRLADIETTAQLLRSLGVSVDVAEPEGPEAPRRLTLDGRQLTSTLAHYDIVRKMRAGVLVLGPMLARHGTARVSLPGGCAIGTRPVDLHLNGLRQLGAEIDLEGGYIVAEAPKGLEGGEVTFPFVSVGATENLMMAATLARGTTRLINAAREPEIVDLADCLTAMGARIQGAGSDRIEIEGVDSLGAATHAVMPDRIETGTYAMAVAATHGDAILTGARPETLGAAIAAMETAGVIIDEVPDGLRIRCGALVGCDVMTEPYPGFPTDLQAQMMALMTLAHGASMLTETIFENRFMHVPELLRMGARINLHGRSAMVRGVPRLTGAPVMATDLRASVALVIAGLAARGETTVSRIYHLDRGYERLDAKLKACGAQIERVAD